MLCRIAWTGILLRTLALVLLVSACGAGDPTPPKSPQPDVARVAVASALDKPDKDGPAEEGPLPISSSDPVRGSRTALVTIVEIADFQCPFCARASATVEQLRREYGPDKLRVVWKHLPLPFHPEARPAAEASAAVMTAGGNDAFWRFHDKLFANQMTLSSASYEEWARDAGVDPAAVKRAMDSGRPRAKIDADLAFAQKLGVAATPVFFVNGVFLSGAQPIEQFRALVDVELEKARHKLQAGVAPDKLHQALAAENLTRRPPQGDDDEDEKPDTQVYKIPVGRSPSRGPADALVTVVVFSDFQCPFCKRTEPTIAELERRYPGALRIVWKDQPLPFHNRAEPAAELAREARAQKGDKAFWVAHEKLFASAPRLEDADLERIAREMSLDVPRAMAAIKGQKHKSAIDADVALADDFNATGTPHFFINGRRLVGARPVDDFAALVDAELARAKAAVARGTPAKDVYEALVKDGAGPSEPEKRTVRLAGVSPASGPKVAPVTLHIFSDFQCPFCSRVLATLSELKKTYGNRVRVEWHNLPLNFHADARPAAEAALEAYAQKGDVAFWKMHDLLFESQRVDGGLKRDALDGYAKKLGLDAKRFAAALDTGKHTARIDEEIAAANQAGIQGTPSFVVSTATSAPSGAGITGYALSGAQPVTKFKKLIDRALADVGAGKPRAVREQKPEKADRTEKAGKAP